MFSAAVCFRRVTVLIERSVRTPSIKPKQPETIRIACKVLLTAY